jgi:hypothetical protein
MALLGQGRVVDRYGSVGRVFHVEVDGVPCRDQVGRQHHAGRYATVHVAKLFAADAGIGQGDRGRHHGADRQVDPGGDNDEGNANGDDAGIGT